MRENIESERDEVSLLADNDGLISVESGMLGFAFIVPVVDGDGAMRGGFVVIGLHDNFFKVSSSNFSGEDDGSFVLFAVTEKRDVGQVGEEIKAEELFDVGE
ncbi:MAG: hypothetical protein ACI9NQ_001718 [Paracoccaceae bacterium]